MKLDPKRRTELAERSARLPFIATGGGAGGRARRACCGGAPARASRARHGATARPRLPESPSSRLGAGPLPGGGVGADAGRGSRERPGLQARCPARPHPGWEWGCMLAAERPLGRRHCAWQGEAGTRTAIPRATGPPGKGSAGLNGTLPRRGRLGRAGFLEKVRHAPASPTPQTPQSAE